MTTAIDWESLKAAATRARERAYAPYSEFKVGAALLTADGQVFVGCNIENASYGAAICAERAALASAIASGAREWTALAIVTGATRPSPPCGICRQCLAEFSPGLPVRSYTEAGAVSEYTLSALLPDAFDRSQLD